MTDHERELYKKVNELRVVSNTRLTAITIITDARTWRDDMVELTPEEATRVAFAILKDRCLQLGKQLLPLDDLCKMFGLELADLTKEGNPKWRS